MTARRMTPSHKFDHEQTLRDEIERRTQAGETCLHIAAALRAQGYDVSSKTISRRRLEWGHRKRKSPATKGTVRPKLSRPRVPHGPGGQSSLIGKKQSSIRKAEITERTHRGETAEQISDALAAEGVNMRKGASTITRLQTFWGLIPYDTERARGRGIYRKTRKSLRAPRSRPVDVRAPSQPAVVHYPSNCRFGPGQSGDAGAMSPGRPPSPRLRRSSEEPVEELPLGFDAAIGVDADVATDTDSGGGSPLPLTSPETASLTEMDRLHSDAAFIPLTIDFSAEVARLEALIDLSNRIAPAAGELKRLADLLRTRTGRFHPGSTTTAIANARMGLRTAAQAIIDMTSDPDA